MVKMSPGNEPKIRKSFDKPAGLNAVMPKQFQVGVAPFFEIKPDAVDIACGQGAVNYAENIRKI